MNLPLKDITDEISQPEPTEQQQDEQQEPKFKPVLFNSLTAEDFEAPPILIEGMAYCGSKILLSGPSKSRKTWLMIDMLLRIQSGKQVFGHQTVKRPALLIDLELMRPNLLRRIRAVKDALGIVNTENLHVLSLRGEPVNFTELAYDMVEFCKQHNIGVIGIDPVYRLSSAEENSNDEVADFLLQVERLAHESGAAILFAHHFAKGNASAKSSLDRMSGAGTWARDPDVLISMTEAEQSTLENPAFVIEPTLRDFKPIKPFAVKWHHPLWRVDDTVSTDLKGQAGRPKGGSGDEILEFVNQDEWIQAKDLKKAVYDVHGIPNRRVHDLIRELLENGKVEKKQQGREVFYTLKGADDYQKGGND